jgi:hypothetical protein
LLLPFDVRKLLLYYNQCYGSLKAKFDNFGVSFEIFP